MAELACAKIFGQYANLANTLISLIDCAVVKSWIAVPTADRDRIQFLSKGETLHRSLPVTRPGAPDDVRSEILMAAATVFMERGYGATSIDDVADSLGATKGRIYHYYRSKMDIFIDIHLEALKALLERVGKIAQKNDLKSEDRLFEMCREHAMVVMRTLAYQKATVLGLNRFLLSVSAPYQDQATRRIQELRDEYENLFVHAVTAGVEDGSFRPINPRFTTKPLLGALNWLNAWYEFSSDIDESRAEEIADSLATFCVNAVKG